MEEVRIKIRSVRFEVEASLFVEDEESDGEEISMYEEREAEPEEFEINTLGTMKTDEGRIEISYEETEATGMDGSVSTVTFMRDNPKMVTMIREGAVSTALVFEAGKRHQCVYNTPFMPFVVCVRTLTVNNRLLDCGYIELDYIVEIRGAQAERTKFRMELLGTEGV